MSNKTRAIPSSRVFFFCFFLFFVGHVVTIQYIFYKRTPGCVSVCVCVSSFFRVKSELVKSLMC